MRKKMVFKESPFGKIALGKRVHLPGIPLLPSPKELAAAEKTQKITLSISAESLRYFKEQAAKYNVPYQAMIRRLLDEYRTKA